MGAIFSFATVSILVIVAFIMLHSGQKRKSSQCVKLGATIADTY
jgi:hypothetical protein